jgi:TolB-like protein
MIFLSIKVFSQSLILDEAIRTTADEIRQQLTTQTKIAVLNFTSNWQGLSTYVIDELNNAIVRNGSLTVVDRQQLDLVRQEQNFQMSGDVNDESAQSIGKFLGAQSVLSGSFTVIGNINRFRIRVIDVETGVVQYSYSINIKKDTILTALMPKAQPAPRQPRQPRPPRPSTPPIEYSVLPLIGLYGSFFTNGGTNGFECETLALQPGINIRSSKGLYLNITGDLMIGWGYDGDINMIFSYNAGGIMEILLFRHFLLGAGGGVGGEIVAAISYPYIRASLSYLFSDNSSSFSLKGYYDYNFENGFKVGFLIGYIFLIKD